MASYACCHNGVEMMVQFMYFRNFSFQEAHVDGAAAIARAAKKAGVKRFIHISAMNAATNAPSKFLQSKVKMLAFYNDSL